MKTETQKVHATKALGWAFFYGERLAKALASSGAL
jgi:hypothetical protein